VAAHERADPGAVDDWHTAQIDDQVAVPAAEHLLDMPFERLGGSAGHQRLLRRHHQAFADRCPSRNHQLEAGL
jgi:hypothetical protein